jgi:ribosomal protein S12 methylthiotransferase accessory factor
MTAVWQPGRRPSEVADALSLARRVIGRRLGMFSEIRPVRSMANQPFFHVQMYPANGEVMPGGGAIDPPGGSGLDLEEAFLSCLFESIERYCASFIRPELVWFARADGDPRFLTSDRMPLFSPGQYSSTGFPFRPITGDSMVRWVEARSLTSGATACYPAVYLFIPFRLAAADELAGPSLSTGLAAGRSVAEACLGGLLEVAERDAFMITWLNRLVGPRLVAGPETSLGQTVARICAANPGSRMTFVDISNDLQIPVVACVFESPWRGRRIVSVGAAARLHHTPAARKAMLEAAMGYQRLTDSLETGPDWRPAPDFSDVQDFTRHALVYAAPELQPELAFLTSSPVERPLVEPPEPLSAGDGLAEALARFAAAGEEAFAVRLTTNEAREAGVEVMKVIVPGAVPMNADHRFPFLGPERLYTVPARLGQRARRSAASELNLRVPHPFA